MPLHIVQKGCQRVCQTPTRLEDRELDAARKEMVGMQSKKDENRRGHQPGHAHKDANPQKVPLKPPSLNARNAVRKERRVRIPLIVLASIFTPAKGQRKAQAEEQKQKGRKMSRGIGVGQQPGARARQRDPPPASAAEPLFPPPPEQGQTQGKQQWQEVGSERGAPQDRLTNGNRQQASPNAADQQAAPRGGPPAFLISAKEEIPQPEEDKDSARAGQGRGQTNGQRRAPKKGGSQRYRIDNQPFASIIFREENRVLSLQHSQGIHSMRSLIVK